MNKFNSFLMRYMLWSLPAVIIVFIWGSFVDVQQINFASPLSWFLWQVLGLNLLLWFLSALYFIVYLLISAKTRQVVLSKLAGIKERDERESQIAGNAAKATFLSSITVLILFLFLSIVSFEVEMLPLDPNVHDGKTQEFSSSIGITLKALDSKQEYERPYTEQLMINYQGLPFTKTGIIVILLIWQLAAYHYFASRLKK